MRLLIVLCLTLGFVDSLCAQSQNKITILWHGYVNKSVSESPVAIIDLNNAFLKTLQECDKRNEYFEFIPSYSLRGKSSDADYALDGEIERNEDGWRISTWLYHKRSIEQGTPCSESVSRRNFEEEVQDHAKKKYDDLARLLIPEKTPLELNNGAERQITTAIKPVEPTTVNRVAIIKQSRFFTQGHNNYLAWGVVDAGYPWKLGTSFLGRHGNILGIGYYLNIGVDWGGKSTYDSEKSINMFHYAAGLKFFAYKNLFISAGYGTLGCQKMIASNSSDGYWNTDGWRQRKGIPMLFGYDVIIGDLNLRSQAFFSFSAGASYDTYTKEWEPTVNVKIGIAWGVK